MRPPRIYMPGSFFHITARGNNKQDIFQSDGLKKLYLDTLSNTFASSRIRLLGYCLMTNHCHLLVQDVRGNSLPHAMCRLQGSYAQAWNREFRRSGHVFGDRYYAEPIEADGHLLIASCYIHNNPVEGGLIRDVRHYRWSSVHAYLGGQSYLPVWSDLILEMCGGPTAYLQLLCETPYRAEDGKGRFTNSETTRSLSILGSTEFREQMKPLIERRAERRRLSKRPNGMTLDQVWAEVERLTPVSRDDICNPGKHRRNSKARKLLCWLARREGISATLIASELKRSVPAVVQLAKRFDPNSLAVVEKS